MNIAILQPLADPHAARSPYRDEVALLGAVLRRRGHKVGLTLLKTCDEAALAAASVRAQPDFILLYVESLAADLSFRVAGAMALLYKAPLIPFGPHAALRPDECLSLPGAEAVALADADWTIPDYLATRQASLDYLRTPGFWVKCETGVMRNPAPRPPESLADQPPPARDLYPSDRLIDPAGFVTVCAARGGEGGGPVVVGPAAAPGGTSAAAAAPALPGWPSAGGAPAAGGGPVLHRPVDAVIREMRRVADKHLDLGGFRVGNERWTSRTDWLAEFAPRYARQVALPLRTTLHAADVTVQAAGLLAKAGCEEARIPLGSGSTLIRNDILGLNVSAEAAEAAFATLRQAGVPSVACVQVGAPYETPASLDQTIALLRRLDPDRVEAVLHYPAPGTLADKAARENGWLVPDPVAAHLAGKPALLMSGLSADDLLTACETLPYAILRPRTALLIRLTRRVRIGKRGTLYERVVKPFLAPPRRKV